MLTQRLTNKLLKLLERREEIHALLSDPDVIKDQNYFRELSKEVSEISPVVEIYERYQSVEKALQDINEMLNDDDEQIRQINREGVYCSRLVHWREPSWQL